MALNIKNLDVESSIYRLARLTGETKTEAIGKAVKERLQRMREADSQQRIRLFRGERDRLLEGRTFTPVTKEEWDEINEVG